MAQKSSKLMGKMAFLAVLGLQMLVPAVLAEEAQAIVGYTTECGPVWDSPDLLQGMSWSSYQKAVKPLSSIQAFVPLQEPLPAGEQQVQYGLNAVLPVAGSKEIRNLSWALITNQDRPPALIVDINGNGVLSDDPRIEFTEKGTGRFEAEQELRILDSQEAREMVLPVFWSARRGTDGIKLFRYSWRECRGSIQIGEEKYAIALRTSLPTFDSAGSLVGIDLNRDRKLQFLHGDVEAFRVEDEYLPLGGREYKISVDGHGRNLTLTPTGRPADCRPSLVVGTKAPMLPNRSPLYPGHGRPVFLNFWSPHCSFSKRMAPQLRQAWEDLHGDVEFVSVTNVPLEEATSIIRGNKHQWKQISGNEGEELFSLYRISAVPTYYAIDAGGVIRASGSTLDWTQVRSVLAGLVSRNSGSSPKAVKGRN